MRVYHPLCLSLMLAFLLASSGGVVGLPGSGVSEDGDKLLEGQQGERQVVQQEGVLHSVASGGIAPVELSAGWPWMMWSVSAASVAKYEDPVGAFTFHYLVINLFFLRDAARRVPEFEFSGHVARHFTGCFVVGFAAVGVMAGLSKFVVL